MQFNFTEHEYLDAYKSGGRLEFVAENAQEVKQLASHFKLFSDVSTVKTLKAHIAALKTGTHRHTIGTDKRPVYRVNGRLDISFSTPYVEWMQCELGYNGPLPDLELARKWDGLCHTNYQARIYTFAGHVYFEAFTTSEPWGGKNAQEYAVSRVTDYIGEEFGTRYYEPEMISAGRSGTLKRNPNHLKKHPAKPAANNIILKRTIFAWWLENHANHAQKAIVTGNQEIVNSTGESMEAFHFDYHQPHIYYEHVLGGDGKIQNYKIITFTEFAAMGGQQCASPV